MEPRHPLAPDKRVSDDNTLTKDDLERIANPMSIILGYTQLLQRRIRRGERVEQEEVLRVLGLMEEATRSIITGLTDVYRKTGPSGEHPDQEAQTRPVQDP